MTKEQKIQELLWLAVLVDQKTDYCVFIRYSGHVQWLEMEIRESKANYDKEVAESRIILHDKDFDERYERAKEVLTSILEKGEIHYDMLEKYERIEYGYRF